MDLETFFHKSLGDVRLATIDLVKFHLSGKIAEGKYFEKRAVDGSSMLNNSACYDNAQIEHYLKTIEMNGEPPIDLEAVTKETAAFIDSPAAWSAITHLAGILINQKELQGDELHKVLSDFKLSQ